MLFKPIPIQFPDKFSFPRQCIALKLNGSWPLDGKNDRIFSKFYIFLSWYIIFSVTITVYFQFEYLIFIFGDIMKTTENCCTTFMGILNLIRLLHMRLFNNDMKELINDFVHNIWIPIGKHKKIEKKIEFNMKIFRAQSVMSILLISLYCTLPMLELFINADDIIEKPFPYKMIFFYDAQKPVIRYAVTYIFTAMAGVAVVTTLFAEDSLFGFFVNHCCGQFQILSEEVGKCIPRAYQRSLKLYGTEGVNEAKVQQEYRRELHKIIVKHNILIDFCDKMDKFFSPIMLVNFTISSIIICMVGFQIVTGKMFIGDLFKFIIYIISSCSQLFILCWNGDALIQNSLDLTWSLYACNWEGGNIIRDDDTIISPDDGTDNFYKTKRKINDFTDSYSMVEHNNNCNNHNNNKKIKTIFEIEDVENESVKIKGKLMKNHDNNHNMNIFYYPGGVIFNKELAFMIMRSQKPCRITAMKFSVLSLQSFTTIMGTSMSYFTLLQSLLE